MGMCGRYYSSNTLENCDLAGRTSRSEDECYYDTANVCPCR